MNSPLKRVDGVRYTKLWGRVKWELEPLQFIGTLNSAGFTEDDVRNVDI